MTTTGIKVVQPYLFFDGKCEEALNFYKKALGAEINGMMRFKESPDPTHSVPGGAEKIMHANFKIGGTEIRRPMVTTKERLSSKDSRSRLRFRLEPRRNATLQH